MNLKLIQQLGLLLIIGSLIWSNSCRNNSEKNISEFDQESYNELAEGVYEYLPPMKGIAIMTDGYYVDIVGESDSTLECEAGRYEISGDTIFSTVLYATNPDIVGNTFMWRTERHSGDTVKLSVFNNEGEVTYETTYIKKIDANVDNLNFTNSCDGVFQYLPPRQGLGIDFESFWVYLGGKSDTTMYAHAGTYIENNDTITNTILFAMNHRSVGNKFRWTFEPKHGDTLQWFTYDKSGEVASSGYSLKLK